MFHLLKKDSYVILNFCSSFSQEKKEKMILMGKAFGIKGDMLNVSLESEIKFNPLETLVFLDSFQDINVSKFESFMNLIKGTRLFQWEDSKWRQIR